MNNLAFRSIPTHTNRKVLRAGTALTPRSHFLLDDSVLKRLESSVYSFKLTLNQGAIDDETFAYLSSFALLLDSYKDIETGAGDLTLSVTSADVPLASLNLTAAYADPFTIPDLNTLSNVLDPVNSEEDANTFISELDWTPVLDNLRTVGVPESLVEQLDTLITEELFGAGDEIYMDTDDVYENTFIEDMPSDSSAGIIGGADGPTSIIVAEEFPEEELIVVD